MGSLPYAITWALMVCAPAPSVLVAQQSLTHRKAQLALSSSPSWVARDDDGLPHQDRGEAPRQYGRLGSLRDRWGSVKREMSLQKDLTPLIDGSLNRRDVNIRDPRSD